MVSNQHRDTTSYLEKYVQVEMKPTIRGFGGRPLEGFLVVGMTGLVQAYVMGGTKGKTTNTEVLGGVRLAYSYVDLAWTKGTFTQCSFTILYILATTCILIPDGLLLAIACTGVPLDPILYCKLSIEKDEGVEFGCLLDEYRLRSEALTGLFPNSFPGKHLWFFHHASCQITDSSPRFLFNSWRYAYKWSEFQLT